MPSADQLRAFSDIASSTLDDLSTSLQAHNSSPIEIQSCRASIDDLAMAAEIIEFQTMGEICKEYIDRFIDCQQDEIFLSPQKTRELAAWSTNLISYLRSPDDRDLAKKITDVFPEDMRVVWINSLFPIPNSRESGLTNTEPSISEQSNSQQSQETQTRTLSNPNDPTQLFIDELAAIEGQLDELLFDIFSPPDSQLDSSVPPPLAPKKRYLSHIDRIHSTAEILDINGIAHLCDFVSRNMSAIDTPTMDTSDDDTSTFNTSTINTPSIENNDDKRAIQFELFSVLPGKIIGLLSSIGGSQENLDQHIIDIATHCENSSWDYPHHEQESHTLIRLLSEASVEIEEDNPEEPTKQLASEADVSVMLSDEVHPELVTAFLHDVPHQTTELSNCIALIRHGGDLSSLLKTAQRLTHSIKGSANIVGIFGVANMAHYLEDILEALHDNPDRLNASLNELLEESADCIESMVDHLAGNSDLPNNAQHLLQQLLNHINGTIDSTSTQSDITKPAISQPIISQPAISQPDLIQEAETQLVEDTSSEVTSLEHTAERTELLHPNEESTPNEALSTQDKDQSNNTTEHENVIQVPAKTIESLFEIVEEMTISLIQTREQVKSMMLKAKNQLTQDEKIQEHRFELEKIVDIKSLSSSTKRMTQNAQSTDAFDSMELDQYSEIHGTVHSFIETVIDSRELNIDMQEQLIHLDSLFVKHLQLNKDLQYLAKSTKMISVKSIQSRLQRCVRHAARITAKPVILNIIDNNLSVDEEILSALTDPLMHIIRNAIDHGIENAEQRFDLGKPDQGNINIVFKQSGNNICIECTDDGQGINAESIRNIALSKGLITQEQNLDQQQCINLILAQGFTTRDKVDQLSGRGVGLDVVNSSIKSLNGKIDITSLPNEGTTIRLYVPLSHLSTHAIIVSLNYERYAIPSQQLIQLLHPHSGEVVKHGTQEEYGYRYNDVVYPLLTMGSVIYGENSHLNKQHITIDSLPILLIDVGNTIVALAVDSIQGNQEIIIKPMGHHIKSSRGVDGVAITADGKLIPVLDIISLILNAEHQSHSTNYEVDVHKPDTFEAQKTVLIVDDSFSVRRSLEHLMNDMGYKTLQAQDGVYAVTLLESTIPDVILTDMEMPRMNGLELSSYVKKSERLQSVPVVMITSRSTRKHRELAVQSGVDYYLTKPYTESDLLDLVDRLIQKPASDQPIH